MEITTSSRFWANTECARNALSRPRPLQAVRIGLITPYNGTNLGDGAIQIATIAGLSSALELVEFMAITLDPVETSRRHGIPSVPTSAFSVSREKLRDQRSPVGQITTIVPAIRGDGGTAWRAVALAKRHAKGIPLLPPILRSLRSLKRRAVSLLDEMKALRAARRIMKELDAIVASGGGQIDDEFGGAWSHPYSLFRWALLARLERKPFIVASVGVHKIRSPLSRYFLGQSLASAHYRSFRETKSKEVAGQWPFTSGDPIVPDLAFGLPGERHRKQHEKGTSLVVGVSPISFGQPGVWPGTGPEVHDAYVRALIGFAAWLLRHGYKVALFKTGGMDQGVLDRLRQALESECQGDAASRLVLPRAATVEELMVAYEAMDIVVASRLHGVTLAHIALRPVLAVSFDRKVTSHMTDVGQEKYCLDFASVTVEDLVRGFQALERDREQESRSLVDAVSSRRREVLSQFERIAGVVRKPGSD